MVRLGFRVGSGPGGDGAEGDAGPAAAEERTAGGGQGFRRAGAVAAAPLAELQGDGDHHYCLKCHRESD